METEILNERKERNNTVLLVIIATATLLVAMVGATFAFFSATVTKTGDTNSVKIQTATIGITYNHGNAVDVTDLMPGGPIDSKTVTIENTSTNYEARYTLKWADGVVNEFTRQEYLTYLVTCIGDGAPTHTRTQLPSTGSTVDILSNITLPANATHTCIFSFQYDYLEDGDQNADQNKTFTGNFEIVADHLPAPTP